MQDISKEFVICCKKPGEVSHEQDSFAHDEDSGSFVLNDQGNVFGVLYGARVGLIRKGQILCEYWIGDEGENCIER